MVEIDLERDTDDPGTALGSQRAAQSAPWGAVTSELDPPGLAGVIGQGGGVRGPPHRGFGGVPCMIL